jgi:hypothetical protein
VHSDPQFDNYPRVQCAAVRIHWAFKRVPPQKIPVLVEDRTSPTCQGMSPLEAAVPPTILMSSLLMDRNPVLPHTKMDIKIVLCFCGVSDYDKTESGKKPKPLLCICLMAIYNDTLLKLVRIRLLFYLRLKSKADTNCSFLPMFFSISEPLKSFQ